MDEVELDEFGYAKPAKPAYLRYGDPNDRVVVDEATDTWYDRQEDINQRNWHFEMQNIVISTGTRGMDEFSSLFNLWLDMGRDEAILEPLEPKKKVKPQAYNFEDYKPYKRKRFN